MKTVQQRILIRGYPAAVVSACVIPLPGWPEIAATAGRSRFYSGGELKTAKDWEVWHQPTGLRIGSGATRKAAIADARGRLDAYAQARGKCALMELLARETAQSRIRT